MRSAPSTLLGRDWTEVAPDNGSFVCGLAGNNSPPGSSVKRSPKRCCPAASFYVFIAVATSMAYRVLLHRRQASP